MSDTPSQPNQSDQTPGLSKSRVLLAFFVIFFVIVSSISLPYYIQYLRLEKLRNAGGIIQIDKSNAIIRFLPYSFQRWMKDNISNDILSSFYKVEGIEFPLDDRLHDNKQFECIRSFLYVESLHLDSTILNDDGLELLNDLAKLKTLFANNTVITGSGLAQWGASKNLLHLIAFETPFTNDGMKNVAQFKKLEWLSLSKTNVTDEGLSHISGLTQLKYLVLDEQPITAVGMKHLKGLTNLINLHLESTRIEDAGLVHLNGMTKLKELYIRNNPQLSKVEVDKLRKALPKCKIFWVEEDMPN